ncbi:MAG: hypothetical protein GC160_13740 [Acidobacteria bacterium]|nr:hypothetical protein [Acidobacteriota bacterium]
MRELKRSKATVASPQASTAPPSPRAILLEAVVPPRPKPQAPQASYRNGPLGSLVVALFLLGALYGMQALVRRAAGEWLAGQGSLDRLELATRVIPDNPFAWTSLGLAQEDGLDALQRAAELQPNDGAAWVRVSLELEERGDVAGAEAAALRAVEVDPGFDSLWTLANFCLRQGREEEFWRYTRQAVRAQPDRTAVAATLWWRLLDDPARIMALAALEEPAVLRRYLDYLIQQRKIEALPEAWEKFEPAIRKNDLPMAGELLEVLLAGEKVDLALEVWNALAQREIIDLAPISLADDGLLTGGDFAHRVSGVGFDWRVDPAPGVYRLQRRLDASTHSFEIRLSGGQEEYSLLLSQIVPTPPSQTYLFHFEYATVQLPFLTGLRWTVRDHRSGRILAQSGPVEAAEDYWNRQEFEFETPPDTRLVRIELSYQREPNTERYRGRFVIRSAGLVRVSPATGAGKP